MNESEVHQQRAADANAAFVFPVTDGRIKARGRILPSRGMIPSKVRYRLFISEEFVGEGKASVRGWYFGFLFVVLCIAILYAGAIAFVSSNK